MPEQARSVDSGAAIRTARIRTGRTLRALAASIGVSVGTMSAIENGKVGLTVDRLRLIAHTLDVPPANLLIPDQTAAPTTHGDRRPAPPAGPDWRRFEELDLDPVLSSAVEVFCDTGYHGATMRMIAAGAGISVAGIYHHYPSKKRLLVALLDTAHQDLVWRLQAAAAAGSDAGRGFANMVEALVLFRERRRELAFVMIAETSRADVLGDRSPRIDHELHDLFASTAHRAARDALRSAAQGAAVVLAARDT